MEKKKILHLYLAQLDPEITLEEIEDEGEPGLHFSTPLGDFCVMDEEELKTKSIRLENMYIFPIN